MKFTPLVVTSRREPASLIYSKISFRRKERSAGDPAGGKAPTAVKLAHVMAPDANSRGAFDRPWAMGWRSFELKRIRPLDCITGPLGSGKTMLVPRRDIARRRFSA
jgi:hypothetical protein